MNISQWPISRIMQLPDYCFGPRWPVELSMAGEALASKFDISKMALPETCVIWELAAVLHSAELFEGAFELRLGDQLPASWPAFQELELLFSGVRTILPPGAVIYLTSMTSVNWQNLKMPVRAAGRRLVLGIRSGTCNGHFIQVALTVSSIPREVPDWLVSG